MLHTPPYSTNPKITSKRVRGKVWYEASSPAGLERTIDFDSTEKKK
jgi:hypothetical protein